MIRFICVLFITVLVVGNYAQARTLTDLMGRTVTVPDTVERVICSGSGCLRLLSYLQGQHLIVAVDDIETRRSQFDARPYALANPQFKTMPVFGQFRGLDNPERILSLEPQPQLIFKTFGGMGYDPDELQAKTGIPVVVVDGGDLGARRPQLQQSLQLMGVIINKSERAEAVINFFEQNISELQLRTADIAADSQPSVYLGGVAYRGPHGFQSTEPTYPPFTFIGARNLAHAGAGKAMTNSEVSKEQIVAWNPDYLFVDLSTLQMGEQAGGLHELRTDPAYATLSAVSEKQIYGVLPYNWYSQNFDSILVNAYFIGKVLYPERFEDIDPASKADQIYTFLLGKPVFKAMNALFSNQAFTRLQVR
ncbi:MAG: iron ABC transporter substrate-binding protein [Desulfobulbaceae bacterium]|nr:iron ABC transporter substrate-binding protein [Desulfobulbaceae bacterium]